MEKSNTTITTNFTDPPLKRGPHRWRKGESGNPRGRPRAPNALAEMVRARLDIDKVLDLADRLLDDEQVSVKDRLAAITALAMIGYSRVPSEQKIDLRAQAVVGSLALDVERLPLAERRRLLDAIKTARRALPAASDEDSDSGSEP